MLKNFALAGLLLLGSSSWAAVLELEAGKTVKEGVTISAGGMMTTDTTKLPMTTVGSGVRYKKVVFSLRVYVAELLVSEVATFKKTEAEALDSIPSQSGVAMHLTFLRDVPADKLYEAFASSLAANGLDSSDPDIAAFNNLAQQGGAGVDGGTLTIAIYKNASGGETLAYENGSYTGEISGAAGLAKKIMSIWLGVPADNQLAQLKTELLQ
ncbi:MAG: chalcone isomerase family protein [Bdellovibrionales bacterium]